MWSYFKKEKSSFLMLCCYMVIEYIRPQSLYPSLDILPWAQTFIILCLLTTFFGREKWVRHPVNIWMIFFQLIITASIINSYWPDIGWDEYMKFFGWLVLYFLMIVIINTKERFYIFLMIFMLASAKLSFFGARTWISRGFGFEEWGIMGPLGFFQNSVDLSVQMLMLMPFGFYLYQALSDKIKTWEKGLLLLLFITPIMTVLGASSRGAQLALVVQLTIMLSKQLLRLRSLLILGAVVILFNLVPEEQMVRFSEIGNDRSSEQRLLYWQHGREMIKEHPVLGVGYFNFAPYYAQHFPDDLIFGFAQNPHNIFIQVGTDTGIIGLFIYGMLILSFFMASFRINRNCAGMQDEDFIRSVSKSLAVGVIGFLVAGQFVGVAYYPFFWVNLAFIVSLQNILIISRPLNTNTTHLV